MNVDYSYIIDLGLIELGLVISYKKRIVVCNSICGGFHSNNICNHTFSIYILLYILLSIYNHTFLHRRKGDNLVWESLSLCSSQGLPDLPKDILLFGLSLSLSLPLVSSCFSLTWSWRNWIFSLIFQVSRPKVIAWFKEESYLWTNY